MGFWECRVFSAKTRRVLVNPTSALRFVCPVLQVRATEGEEALEFEEEKQAGVFPLRVARMLLRSPVHASRVNDPAGGN